MSKLTIGLNKALEDLSIFSIWAGLILLSAGAASWAAGFRAGFTLAVTATFLVVATFLATYGWLALAIMIASARRRKH